MQEAPRKRGFAFMLSSSLNRLGSGKAVTTKRPISRNIALLPVR